MDMKMARKMTKVMMNDKARRGLYMISHEARRQV